MGESDYSKTIRQQYKELSENCKVQMDRFDKELPPPREDLHIVLKEHGVSRRDFLKWTSAMTAALMLPPIFKPLVAKAAENFSRLPIVWLHFAECTGCTESMLRSAYPDVASIILETISLEYHETIMAAAGDQAEKCLQQALADFPGKFICVIEGAIPRGLNGQYMRLGPKGKTGLEIGREVTSRAAATIAIGACAVWGNIVASNPNPTDATGVGKALGITTVNIAGCPPNTVNFVGTLLYYLMFGALPPLDSQERPLWAYGKRIHDVCERRSHYDAGEFVEEWGDEGAKNGWCLYKVGCKGPYTFANCGHLRFNDRISWPVMAGHGCMGCTEIGFWDKMAPLELPLSEAAVGGGEKTVDDVGIALTALATAGVAAHAVLTALRHADSGKKDSPSHKDE